MRVGRHLVVIVVAATAAAVPATAFAATPAAGAVSKGVVVARETGRGTLVVAGARGVVRTLRTSARPRVGTRIAAKAIRLADGTYRAAAVTGKRLVRSARVRGVVVRVAQGRVLLSAGGSVFSVGLGRGLSSATAAPSLQPGTLVDATLAIDPSSEAVDQTQVRALSQTSLVSLEGTVTSLAAGSLVLAVEEGAATTIAIPASIVLPAAIAVGDRVELLAQVANGVFTLVTIQDDRAAAQSNQGVNVSGSPSTTPAGHESGDDQGEVEAEGVVTATAPGSLTVQGGDGASAVTFVVPAGFDVSAATVGARVHAKGALGADGAVTLVKLEVQGAGEHQHGAEVEAEGTVAAVAAGSLTIQPAGGGAPVVFVVPAGLDVSAATVGTSVHARGTRAADGTVTLTKLEVQQGDGEAQHGAEVEAEGTVSAASATSLTIAPAGGGAAVVFVVPAGFDVSTATVGASVQAKGTRAADGTVTLTKLEVQGAGKHGGDSGGGSTGGSGSIGGSGGEHSGGGSEGGSGD